MVGWLCPEMRAAAPRVPARAMARNIRRSLHSIAIYPFIFEWTKYILVDFKTIRMGLSRWQRSRRSIMATSDTMQAAVLDAANTPFRVTTIARPKAQAGQVLVRIIASGVTP